MKISSKGKRLLEKIITCIVTFLIFAFASIWAAREFYMEEVIVKYTDLNRTVVVDTLSLPISDFGKHVAGDVVLLVTDNYRSCTLKQKPLPLVLSADTVQISKNNHGQAVFIAAKVIGVY